MKKLDSDIAALIDKPNKDKDEVAYLHLLLSKRHDYMLMYFYAKGEYKKHIPDKYKIKDILLDRPFYENEYVNSMDDSSPDGFILLEDAQGNKAVCLHELKCGRSKRMVSKGVEQLEKYVKEVSGNFSEVICILTYGKRSIRVPVANWQMDFWKKNGMKGIEIEG